MQDMSHSLHSLMPLTLEQPQTLRPAPQASVHSASTSSSKRQLRVHMAEIGHPIVGDDFYGAAAAPRVMLHAAELRLQHPVTGLDLAWHSAPDF